MLQTGLFYLLSAFIILSSIGVVACRSAVYSVLCLVVAMGLMAGLFVLLKAFFVATILILVYAGAILVLFLFVVMMLDFGKLNAEWQGLRLSSTLAIVGGILFFVQCFSVIRSIPPMFGPELHGTTAVIGRTLFSQYVLPFELTSFLLLAAVVSVVVLAKKDS